MVTKPAVTPETMPDEEPTVAIDTLEDDHVPPPASARAVVPPTQTWLDPLIADGAEITVNVLVAVQPVGSV